MMRTLFALFVAALALVPQPATARGEVADGTVQLRAAPTQLDPGKAYLLIRSSRAKSGLFSIEHVLVRVPSDAELDAFRSARQAAYEKALPGLQKRAKSTPVPTVEQFAFDYSGATNAFATKSNDFLVDGEMRTLLIEALPGTYILYGTSVGTRALVTCNCLGTVRFEARPGVITDLGELYADKVHKPSPVPNLEDNVGPSMFNYGFILGQALAPATAQTAVPAALRGFTVEPAAYHAVGIFHEPGVGSINRLAPVPGILGYDQGKVLDLRTGKPAV